jgi:hypothetical protein
VRRLGIAAVIGGLLSWRSCSCDLAVGRQIEDAQLRTRSKAHWAATDDFRLARLWIVYGLVVVPRL